MNKLIRSVLNAMPMKVTIEMNAETLEEASEELIRFLRSRGIQIDKNTASPAIMAVVRKIKK